MPSRHLPLPALVLAACLGLAAAGCERDREAGPSRRSAPVAPVADIIARHAPELMRVPGVVGVYEGETGRHTPCIRILVARRTSELEKRLPRELEGRPVEIEVTGVIRPL